MFVLALLTVPNTARADGGARWPTLSLRAAETWYRTGLQSRYIARARDHAELLGVSGLPSSPTEETYAVRESRRVTLGRKAIRSILGFAQTSVRSRAEGASGPATGALAGVAGGVGRAAQVVRAQTAGSGPDRRITAFQIWANEAIVFDQRRAAKADLDPSPHNLSDPRAASGAFNMV